MRLALALPFVLLAAACAGPHSTGALWSQQNLEGERALYQRGDSQRAADARAFELSLADETLARERERLRVAVSDCPEPAQVFGPSPSDALRDTVRVRAAGDASRLEQLTDLALTDWYVRRGNATGDGRFCLSALGALAGNFTPAEPIAGSDRPLLDGLPAATVTRDQAEPTPPLTSEPSSLVISQWVLGYTDSVHAAAPLPQYLSVVYGGLLQLPPDAPAAMDSEAAASLVDVQAPDYPEWEPDALYAALRAGRP